MEEKIVLGHLDTDFKGNWKMSSIFSHFSHVATTHAMSFGGWNPELKDQYGWIISKMRLVIHKQAKINQEVTIKTWVTEGTHVIYPRQFEILNSEGEVIAEATSNWTLLDLVRRRIAMPKRVGLTFPEGLDQEGNISFETDFNDEEGFEFVEDRQVRYSEIDVNGHLNNARYVDYACDVLGFDLLKEGYISDISVQFKKETAPNQVLRLEKKFDGKYFKVRGLIDDNVHFIAEGLWKKY